MIVVDASLAMKWIIAEDDSQLARELFVAKVDAMHASDLLLVEVCQSLVRRANERKSPATVMSKAIHDFAARTDEGVHLHRVTPDPIKRASELALSLGHPLKDCIYLALADGLGCPLATSDLKFHDRVGDPARVKLLAELV